MMLPPQGFSAKFLISFDLIRHCWRKFLKTHKLHVNSSYQTTSAGDESSSKLPRSASYPPRSAIEEPARRFEVFGCSFKDSDSRKLSAKIEEFIFLFRSSNLERLYESLGLDSAGVTAGSGTVLRLTVSDCRHTFLLCDFGYSPAGKLRSPVRALAPRNGMIQAEGVVDDFQLMTW